VAGDKVLAARVRRDRMPLDFVWLQRYHNLQTVAKAAGKEFLGPADPVAACDEYIKLAHQWGVHKLAESGSFAREEERMKRWFQPPGPPPVACKDMPEGVWIDLPDYTFRLSRVGEWADFVDDPKAADGKAVRMPGDHHQWAIAAPLTNDVTRGGSWRVYAVARAEATVQDGDALRMGIYDDTGKRNLPARTISVAEATGDYHVFDLGAYEMRGNMYAWMAPRERPGEVTAVYIDRVYLVREKAKTPENP